MVCKILVFDYKEADRLFFEKNPLSHFCIKFFSESLNSCTVKLLSENDISEANAISISEESKITPDIIERFTNMRIIATRSKDCNHIDLLSCVNKNIAVVKAEPYVYENNYCNFKTTFSGITSVLCGDKTKRVI